MKSMLLAGLIVMASAANASEVTVLAASSLQGPLDQVTTNWERLTGNTVTITYSSSQELAASLIAGGSADIFISATPDLIDGLQAVGRVTARVDFLGNRLVLIANGVDAPPVDLRDLPALLGNGLLSIALVDGTLAGQYTKTALVDLGLWGDLSRSIVQSDSLRGALDYVARGEAPFGIVYATDTASAAGVSIVATFPTDSYPPIVYTAALLSQATGLASRAFFDALSAASADVIFSRAGFAVLD
jgi:molybdate transport system substrate-binding protein